MKANQLYYQDFQKVSQLQTPTKTILSFKTILDFQLKNHENFIKAFVEIFKSIDLDNDGIIYKVGLKKHMNC